MKFTIWETNNIHNLLGSQKLNRVSALETILNLRKKFKLSDKELEKWDKLQQLLSSEKDKDEDDVKFVKEYSKTIHTKTLDISVSKKEFQFISDKILGDEVRLPSSPGIIEKSIAFVQKLENKKEEEGW